MPFLIRFAITLAAAVALAAQQAPKAGAGVGVKLEGREILRVWAATPPFSAEERAAEIARRVERIAESAASERIPVTAVETGLGTVLLTGSTHLMVVTDADAKAAGVTRAELSTRFAAAIQEAVQGYQRSHSVWAYVVSISQAIGVWILFGLVCWLVYQAFGAAAAAIHAWFRRKSAATRARGVILQLWERAALLALFLFKVFIGVFLLFQFSFVLSFTLGLFPQTAHISTTFLDYLKSTLAAAGTALFEYLPSGGFVVIVALFTHYLLQMMRVFAVAVERGDIAVPGIAADVARPTYQLLRIVVIIFALVIAYPYLPGGRSEAFKGIAIFLGVLVSISSGSVVGNLFAGIVLTYMRPYKVGDRILVAGTLGAVIHRNLLVTRLRTFKNEEVVIPNASILNGQVLNYSAFAREDGFILNTAVTIGYDTPWRKVHEILLEAARRTEGVKQSPEPFILQKSLNDFHVSYQLNAYSDRPEEWERLYGRLHQNIQDCFNEAGVEIMSPTYLSLRDGNTVTMPPDFRPPGYEPPGFRVSK